MLRGDTISRNKAVRAVIGWAIYIHQSRRLGKLAEGFKSIFRGSGKNLSYYCRTAISNFVAVWRSWFYI
jgi:hypothetical protein